MKTLVQIRRHPIKGIGTELLESAALSPGRALDGDRAWAVLQEGQDDTGAWQPRRNFVQCATGPALMAVGAQSAGARITLTHPDHPPLTIDPETDGAALVDWLRPLWPTDRPAPMRMIRAPDQGMSDADYASVSLMSHSSLRALSEQAGARLDPRRFRGNLWVDGLAPWEELDWIGKTLSIGTAECEVVEPIERCRATEANPETGRRDVNILRLLSDGWGHQDFGINLRVTRPGQVRLGDRINIA